MATAAKSRAPTTDLKPADDEAEWFDVVDANNEVISHARRSVVHAEGLRHRAVHVLLFRNGNEVLLQRRSVRKRIGAGLWDLSAAEHLTRGEQYKAAAVRGLSEELGLPIEGARLTEVLPPTLNCGRYEEQGVLDNEFIAVFAAQYFQSDGAVHADAAEVAETRWAPVSEVLRVVDTTPHTLTPWFRRAIERTDLAALALKTCESSVEEGGEEG